MIGIGIFELFILIVVLGMGIVAMAVIYFVVRAAIRAGNRKNPGD